MNLTLGEKIASPQMKKASTQMKIASTQIKIASIVGIPLLKQREKKSCRRHRKEYQTGGKIPVLFVLYSIGWSVILETKMLIRKYTGKKERKKRQTSTFLFPDLNEGRQLYCIFAKKS